MVFGDYIMPNLNNPGGGNCGFYAFGIGLIDAIQQEHSDAGTSPTLDKLNDFLEQPLRIEDIISFDLKEYGPDYMRYNREFMDKLQASLRNIAVHGYKKDLHTNYVREIADPGTQIEGTMIFNKFMELVHSKKNNKTLSSQFNELVLSPEVNQLAQLVAMRSQNLSQNLTSDQRDVSVRRLAKDIFMRDIFDETGDFKKDSDILAATNIITNSGQWATHQDLQSIAAELGINLNVNGQLNGANTDGAPTVILKNSSNFHWTTEVESKTGLEETLPSTVIPQEISSLSPTAQKVFLAMISAVESAPKQEQFKEFVSLLIQSADKFEPAKKIDVEHLDTAHAVEGQNDEEFAQSLQEAEFRKVGLKR